MILDGQEGGREEKGEVLNRSPYKIKTKKFVYMEEKRIEQL